MAKGMCRALVYRTEALCSVYAGHSNSAAGLLHEAAIFGEHDRLGMLHSQQQHLYLRKSKRAAHCALCMHQGRAAAAQLQG
jgi:hypothetical protein